MGNDGFQPIPTMHLKDSNTNAVICAPNSDLLSLLNTNEVYDFTVARFEYAEQYYVSEPPITVKTRGLKVIKVEHNDRLMYKDFKNLLTQ